MHMTISFSGNEILSIAIDIERRGIAFYDVMAKSAEDERVRLVFQRLVDMEHQHIQTFRDMLAESGENRTQQYSGEEAGYLAALADSAVFSDDDITSEMVTRLDSDTEALELAARLEKDSILFYYQMKDILPAKEQPLVDSIIAEEKSHLRDISVIRRELAQG